MSHHAILMNGMIVGMCFSHGLLVRGLFIEIAAAFPLVHLVRKFSKIGLAKVLSFELRQVHFSLNLFLKPS